MSASTNTRDEVEPMKYDSHVFCTSVSAGRRFVFHFNQRIRLQKHTWGVQVLRYPNFFLGNGSRNVKVVGGDVAVL